MSEPTELFDYVGTPDKTFKWRRGDTITEQGVACIDLLLTSQSWKGLPWTHQMEVFVPDRITDPGLVTIYVTAGWRPVETEMGRFLAAATNSVYVCLYDVPNQPLLGGLVEDALIAHTFVRYLDTLDPTWPLLLPMVKSVVRAMDALQQLGAKAGFSAERFLISGASKRGWTSWLTATADARVTAIAPMVYDNLHIPAQLKHQMKTAGAYSDRIDDYTAAGLPERQRTPEGRHLAQIVDPYTYRERLTLPKLLIHGANDPYWMTDATNLYWNDLIGPKSLLYMPNIGHSLIDTDRLYGALAAFIRAQAGGKNLPILSWFCEPTEQGVRAGVSADASATGARFWMARAAGRDFREAAWSEITGTASGEGSWTVSVSLPDEGGSALFAEVDFAGDPGRFRLSTPMYITGPETDQGAASSSSSQSN